MGKLHTGAGVKPRRFRLEVCPQRRGSKPWKVTKGGSHWADCDSQEHGIELAQTLAAQIVGKGDTVTLKIKRPDGTIREERTYPRRSDPKRSKG